LQGPYRYSFWAEVYETILCVYIVLPTMLALISPKLGKFNVTAKGTNRDRNYFDRRIALPYIILLALNVIGFCVGLWDLFTKFGENADSLVLNLLWTSYNIVILSVCTAVAWEQREIRRSVRITAELPARIRLPDGSEMDVRTLDLSEGGVMLRLPRAVTVPLGTRMQVALMPDYQVVWTGADITRSSGEILAMKFAKLTLPQERQLVYAIFGRADAWLHWAERRPADKVGSAFGKLFSLGLGSAKKAISPSKR
jgi:cellulose synthase (UDP-forming)